MSTINKKDHKRDRHITIQDIGTWIAGWWQSAWQQGDKPGIARGTRAAAWKCQSADPYYRWTPQWLESHGYKGHCSVNKWHKRQETYGRMGNGRSRFQGRVRAATGWLQKRLTLLSHTCRRRGGPPPTPFLRTRSPEAGRTLPSLTSFTRTPRGLDPASL